MSLLNYLHLLRHFHILRKILCKVLTSNVILVAFLEPMTVQISGKFNINILVKV